MHGAGKAWQWARTMAPTDVCRPGSRASRAGRGTAAGVLLAPSETAPPSRRRPCSASREPAPDGAPRNRIAPPPRPRPAHRDHVQAAVGASGRGLDPAHDERPHETREIADRFGQHDARRCAPRNDGGSRQNGVRQQDATVVIASATIARRGICGGARVDRQARRARNARNRRWCAGSGATTRPASSGLAAAGPGLAARRSRGGALVSPRSPSPRH